MSADLKEFKSRLSIGQKIDWGNWDMGWMGSFVIIELKKNHVIMRSYDEKIMIRNVETPGPWVSEQTYKYTYRTLAHRIRKNLGDTRFAIGNSNGKLCYTIVNLAKCKSWTIND